MKGNIKKLAVFVMIAAIAMFTVVVMASAFDRDDHRNAIQGQYAVTGSAVCISAPKDSIDITKDNFILAGGFSGYSPDVVEGVYTFHENGTGTFKGKLQILLFGASGPVAGASADTEWDFHYSVSAEGDITFTKTVQTTVFTSGPPKGVTTVNQGGPLHGRISFDQYHLTVTCGPTPIAEWPPGENSLIIGADGSQLLCIINLAGQRK